MSPCQWNTGTDGPSDPNSASRFPSAVQLDESKTDFLPMPWKHSRAERPREQLSTQTHAKHRTIAPDQFCDEAAFFGQKWMLVCFISTHGTAHHNQALNIIGPRKAGSQIQTSDVCMQTSRLSFGSDQSGALPRYVLQYCPTTSHASVFGLQFTASFTGESSPQGFDEFNLCIPPSPSEGRGGCSASISFSEDAPESSK